MTTRADRIRTKLAGFEAQLPKVEFEAAMLRKIAHDLMTKAADLEELAIYQAKEIAALKDDLIKEEQPA
jgi:hypothetical protein